ncbi:MAG: alpha/beta fold hydrolase [Candidatus Kapabacteria bacterium]|nr:alpha/beta fold hydrolase [Candidatus Kapabacteria bacterium]
MPAVLVCIVISVAVVALYYAIHHILPYSAICPARVTSEKLFRYTRFSVKPDDYHLTPSYFAFITRDSLQLAGWYCQRHNAKGTVIILHGIASCKEMTLHAMKRYYDDGYSVVAYDSRAHGQSGGQYCTLGYYEKFDVQSCIDFISTNLQLSKPFILHGNSMGAAIALQAMAIDKRIAAGVCESSFATLHETMYDYMDDFFHVRWSWLAEPVFRRTEEIASFIIRDVSPENSARSITQPVLLVHGDADEKIDVSYVHRNYNALASDSKELYVVSGGGHFNLPDIGGKKYEQHILRWLNKNIPSSYHD